MSKQNSLDKLIDVLRAYPTLSCHVTEAKLFVSDFSRPMNHKGHRELTTINALSYAVTIDDVDDTTSVVQILFNPDGRCQSAGLMDEEASSNLISHYSHLIRTQPFGPGVTYLSAAKALLLIESQGISQSIGKDMFLPPTSTSP